MDGPSFAPIIIPLVVTPVLAFWLIMVYWAAAHPAHKPRRPAAGRPGAAGEVAVRPKDRADVPARAGPGARARPEVRADRGGLRPHKARPGRSGNETWATAAPDGPIRDRSPLIW